MTVSEFQSSLSSDSPPDNLNALLLALWHDAKGDWEKSHDIISEIHSTEASLIHAYLHRKEGDLGNADYWYQRAGTLRKDISLDEEWNELAERLTAL